MVLTLYEYSNTWKDQLTKITEYTNFIKTKEMTFTYDANGNPTAMTDLMNSYQTKTLSWDGRQLNSLSYYCTGMSFKYNDQGIRTYKSVGGCSGGYSVNYVLDGSKILAETKGTSTIYYTYDADGTLISMNYNGNEYFYITNMQGDVVELVDISGNTVVKYKYDAWGAIIYQYDSGLGVANANPFRYRSYYFDSETGWYYLQSRYYNPLIGRFISADGLAGSVGNVTSMNMYAYCANNPLMNADPSGKAWWHWAIAGAVVIGLGIAVVATAGGALPATLALLAVANGAAASSVGLTVITGLFIGATTAFAGASIIAVANSVNNDGLNVDNLMADGEMVLAMTIEGGFWGGIKGLVLSSQINQKNTPPKISDKILGQSGNRGWDESSIIDTVGNPYTTRDAMNKENGNPATAFFNQDGSYVVVDDYTNEVIQISKRSDPNWIPDSTIVNPYYHTK